MSTIRNGRRSKRKQVSPQPAAWPLGSPVTYRWLAGVLVPAGLLVAALTPHDQRRLRMPDPWGYEIAAQQFAQGNWVLNSDEIAVVDTDVRLRGGSLDQYIPLGDGQWAFRQSPGYPLMLVPFYRLGIPRLANLLLALAAGLVLYRLLARWYDEQTAAIGVVLLTWSPITLLVITRFFDFLTVAFPMSFLPFGNGKGWRPFHTFLRRTHLADRPVIQRLCR